MGVYIKDIKMPTNCESCPCKTTEAFGGLGCQATGYIPLRKADQDRPDNCPLIHVPPHGRLIDADELAEKHRELAYELRGANYDFHMTAKAWVDNALTIIPAEESDMNSFINTFEKDDEEDDIDSFIHTFEKDDEEDGMDSFIHIFEEDDEEDEMDSFIRIFKD